MRDYRNRSLIIGGIDGRFSRRPESSAPNLLLTDRMRRLLKAVTGTNCGRGDPMVTSNTDDAICREAHRSAF
jgi:hypothetical protein